MSRDVTFLIYRDSLGAIYNSIALVPAAHLQKHGVETNILCMAPPGEYIRPALRSRWHFRREQSEQLLPGGVERIPVSPSRLSRWMDDAKPLAHWMNRNPDAKLLHCCGAAAAYFAIQARRRAESTTRVIFHSLGPIADEYAYSLTGDENATLNPKQECRKQELRVWEKTAYTESDAVICISEAMRKYAVGRRGGPNRIVRVPCAVDTANFSTGFDGRESLRAKMGWESRLVVAFCGAIHAWQKPEALIRCFKIIKNIEPRAFFLLLPYRAASVQYILRQSGILPSDIAVISAERADIPSWLAASDIGLLGRGLFEAPSRVNTFSSPIKVGEYLAAGLPVVMSDGVGDASALISSCNAGCVFPENAGDAQVKEMMAAFLHALQADQESVRRRCLETARKHLDIRLMVDELGKLYEAVTDL